MMNIRMKFKKEGKMRFISHLDLMRTFQRAIKRAGIATLYTQGFNPRPEMTFAHALGLGISSVGEYLDIKIEGSIDLKEIMIRLNSNLPKGIKVIKIALLSGKDKNAMSIVSHGSYKIKLAFGEKDVMNIKKEFQDFVNQESIFAKKFQPKKNKTICVDIKPLIQEAKIELENGGTYDAVIDCIVSCGSSNNLRPELIVKSFQEYLGIKILKTKIERINLFTDKDNILTPLIKDNDLYKGLI